MNDADVHRLTEWPSLASSSDSSGFATESIVAVVLPVSVPAFSPFLIGFSNFGSPPPFKLSDYLS
jgi:hypothetical protein